MPTATSKSDKPLRVAFVGKTGTGKSTQAQLLRQKYKGDVLSFASPLKKVCRDLFGDQMDDPAFARKAHQQVGQLCRMLGGPTFWTDKLVVKVSPDRNCFVDDVRYISEYYALKALGFVVIKLAAPMEALQERRPDMTPEMWEHDSEVGIDFIRADYYFATDTDDVDTLHQHIVNTLVP